MALRILIVEDEPLIALDLQAILQDAGHMVIGFAVEFKGAFSFAAANRPLDLAIMDVDLASASDGVEVARRLRVEHDVASLFVSARLDDDTQARASEWQPSGFVGKPFREVDILRAIA